MGNVYSGNVYGGKPIQWGLGGKVMGESRYWGGHMVRIAHGGWDTRWGMPVVGNACGGECLWWGMHMLVNVMVGNG